MGTSVEAIRVGCSASAALVRITGRAAAERARDFDVAVRRMASEGIAEVHLDLAGCPLMDSTFCGTLAGMAEERVRGVPWVRFVLHGARARILDGLANLEVLPLLRVAEAGEPFPVEEPLRDLPRGLASKQDMGWFCLRAHESLGRLGEANVERFAELRRMLSEELARNAPDGAAVSTGPHGPTPAAPGPDAG